jgi:hypothetical protein
MSLDSSRRGGLECTAVNPKTGKIDLVLTFSYDRLNTILNHRDSLGDKYTVAYLVREALVKPCAVFEGIRFDEDEKHSCQDLGWLCYCYRPEFQYLFDGRKAAAPVGKVFLVFVNNDHEIYHWVWERAEPDLLQCRKYLPINFKNRFNKQIF